ncbi:hypothetical protein RJ641_017510 [Dillenia turbinata]|uniref:Uncharacterized protein n=1 Tax=Dillenia turbinata TaxID=194707 RepID=A0AAN8ULJ4_9MAGN
MSKIREKGHPWGIAPGRDLAHEGNEIMEVASTWSPELAAAYVVPHLSQDGDGSWILQLGCGLGHAFAHVNKLKALVDAMKFDTSEFEEGNVIPLNRQSKTIISGPNMKKGKALVVVQKGNPRRIDNPYVKPGVGKCYRCGRVVVCEPRDSKAEGYEDDGERQAYMVFDDIIGQDTALRMGVKIEKCPKPYGDKTYCDIVDMLRTCYLGGYGNMISMLGTQGDRTFTHLLRGVSTLIGATEREYQL